MALPIRAIARAVMGSWIASGASAAAFTKYLQATFGAAYRRTTLLADWREISGLARFEHAVRGLSNNKIPSPFMMVEHVLRREAKYRIHAEATFYNTDTGEEERRKISWYTDTSGTKDDWISEYGDYMATTELYPYITMYDAEIYNIEHYDGKPY